MIYRVLLCLFLGLGLCVVALDAGQGTTKDTAKKPAGPGTVEVYKNQKGNWRYRVKNGEGKTIAMPLPQMHWETKAECLRAIEELRVTLTKARPTEVKD